MVWIGSVRCKKFYQDIAARTFVLNALVWFVLQQVSCNSKMVLNAPKRKETNQNLSLGSNGVGRQHSLRKILARHHGTNFCNNCTSWRVLQQVSCSSKTVPNAQERKETHKNMSLGSNGVDREHSLRKF
jgi:hypothetical protein